MRSGGDLAVESLGARTVLGIPGQPVGEWFAAAARTLCGRGWRTGTPRRTWSRRTSYWVSSAWPGPMHSAQGAGGLGYAFPAALGAASTVDGPVQAELATAVQHNLRAVASAFGVPAVRMAAERHRAGRTSDVPANARLRSRPNRGRVGPLLTGKGRFTVRRSLTSLGVTVALLIPGSQALAAPAKVPVAVGYGGAVASIDQDATAIGIAVLRRGGTAVDAAVATAAALGVTDPFSTGIGGGGFFVYYEARTGKVYTIDGRETAPMTADSSLFLENGKPIPFAEGVTSGLGVGVPGTPKTWQRAVQQWGRFLLKDDMRPAEQLARNGFIVDQTFHDQVANNATRFAAFPSTRSLYLPGGQPPAPGTRFRNPDLADTYHELADTNLRSLYNGPVGRDLVQTVQNPRRTRRPR
ncbi:hypothetical protein GCM10029964_032780 [Kibdelosporangium lantanae]